VRITLEYFNKEMTKQDLLREARMRYPVGSKFIDLVHGETFTVSSHAFDSFGDDGQLYIPVEAHISKPNKTARIYRSGKWADSVDVETGEILLESPKSPMEIIQEECKKRFPIGCEYVCAISGGSKLTLLSDDYAYSIYGNEIWAHSGGGYLYKDGIYAVTTHSISNPYSKIELIQEECKKRFPIGCEYISIGSEVKRNLREDSTTYSVYTSGKNLEAILAHNGGGVLYQNGMYAELCTPLVEPEKNVKFVDGSGSICDWTIQGADTKASGAAKSQIIQEVSFKRIGAMRKNKVQLDKLIEEIGFTRIKSK
jgi:hypothetical protein